VDFVNFANSFQTGSSNERKTNNNMMCRLILLSALLWSTILFPSFGQGASDPILFTVNKKPIHVSEFVYIYTKTNGAKADFSKRSLEEYLRLYTKFKLKVERAKELQLDTLPALSQELEGYRRQLADSYLIDREVTEQLIQEVYERRKQDVNISHILVGVGSDARPDDTLRALQRAQEARKLLLDGKPFEEVALQYSTDQQVQNNKGRVGYVTAMFPNGLYALENAAYELPVGSISEHLRSPNGFHLIAVHDRRPARGELEAAHILIRVKEEADAKNPKMRIDSIYQALLQGASFEELAKSLSEDQLTNTRGGNVGVFGINRYELAFEDAAFGIEQDGGFSEPFLTKAGWHIVQRISRKSLEPYNVARPGLQNRVKSDMRFEQAKKAMIERIKRENNFMEFNTTLDKFTASLDEDFLSYKWKAPEEKSSDILFTFGSKFKVGLNEFYDYLERASRNRIRMARTVSIPDAVRSLYQGFVEESALKFEEQQLNDKYPEFRALMREYEEGILLFEVTKQEVWDKASQDSAGLVEFFPNVSERYTWNERAVVSYYTLSGEQAENLAKIQKYVVKNGPAKVLAKFNKTGNPKVLTQTERTLEKDRHRVLNDMEWRVGALSKTEVDPRDKTITFMKIERIIPASSKTLDEARGYVVADYQDHLERRWVQELQQRYQVEVNRDVLESLIKD
jgi:peptidyl-prolyl cis-trans isomerase SurA